MQRPSLKETIGFLGVVGSLIFVGFEVRQNTMAARANAYQQMGASLTDIWLASAQDPERAVITLEFMEDESAVFTPAEEAVLVSQSIAAFRQLETTWRQVELGLLDPKVMRAFGWDTEASPAFLLHMKQIWPRIGPQMSPDFRRELESQFGF